LPSVVGPAVRTSNSRGRAGDLSQLISRLTVFGGIGTSAVHIVIPARTGLAAVVSFDANGHLHNNVGEVLA
jgi:hypothetical protein